MELESSENLNSYSAVYTNTSSASPASPRHISVYKHFSGAGKVCIVLRRRKGVFKYFPGFSGAGEMYLNTYPASEKYFYIYILFWYLSSAGEAWEVFKTPFRRQRSIYIHPASVTIVSVYLSYYLAEVNPISLIK